MILFFFDFSGSLLSRPALESDSLMKTLRWALINAKTATVGNNVDYWQK